MPSYNRSFLGFTLIELLIALAIISIALSLTVGSFPMIERYNVEHNARNVVNAVMYSRSLAIKEGNSVFLCPSKNSSTCDKTWSNKILVYKNNNSDKTFDQGDDLLQVYSLESDAILIRWGSFQRKDYLEFRANGMSNYQNGTFTVCHTNRDTTTAIPIIINVAGRPYFGRDKNNDGIREYSSGKPVKCS